MKDSHIHLALSPLKDNWEMDTQDFIVNGGQRMLTQGTDIDDFEENIQIAEKINKGFGDIVDIALGIHPTVFHEKYAQNSIDDIPKLCRKMLDRYKEYIAKEKENLTAIGETGLDYFEMYNLGLDKDKIEIFKEIQKESFRLHIRIAIENNLPLSIHAREIEGNTECVYDALKILAHEGKGLARGSFHSYTGELKPAKDLLDLGFYIGFNAILTYPSGTNVREILKETPTDRILFETDGPFLAVQSVRRDKKALVRYGRSSQIKEIIDTASEIKSIPPKYLEEISDENYNNLFKPF